MASLAKEADNVMCYASTYGQHYGQHFLKNISIRREVSLEEYF